MKKVLIVLSLLSMAATVNASIDTNLKYGQRGQGVSELQEFLADKGFLSSSPSGFFGLLTLKAVKAYQTSKNLPPTGFVGSMTRQSINAEIDVEVAVSNDAEIKEVGTTTPAKQESTVVVSVMPTPSPIVEAPKVVEENYSLGFKNVRVYNDGSGVNTRQVSFSFMPIATLNGYPIEVTRCWTTLFGKDMASKLFKNNVYDGRFAGEDMVVFTIGTPSIVNSLNKGEPNTFSCTLVNGKTITN